MNIDIAPGTVHGIELLNANFQLARANGGRLVIAGCDGAPDVVVPLVAAE